MNSIDSYFTSTIGNFKVANPEPQSLLGMGFQTAMKAAASVFSSGATGMSGQIDPQYLNLMQQQIAMQEQLQLVSLYTNIERSTHETRMAPIRNVRVG